MGYQGALFSPIKIGTLSLRNRIVMAPMATGFGTYAGQVTDRLIRYYAERAKGGVGLIVTEGNAVAAEGRSGINRLGLYDDNQIAGHKKLTEARTCTGYPRLCTAPSCRWCSFSEGIRPISAVVLNSALFRPGGSWPRDYPPAIVKT